MYVCILFIYLLIYLLSMIHYNSVAIHAVFYIFVSFSLLDDLI